MGLFSKRLWQKIIVFVNSNVSDECLTREKCLLSDCDSRVVVLITILVKYRIFICHLNNWLPSYEEVILSLHKVRDIHLAQILINNSTNNNLTPYYEYWGPLIADSIFDAELNG